MTEKADYITESNEALDMLGTGYEPSIEIEEQRTVTERRGGKLVEVERTAFVKLFTSFKKELKDLDGDALKVWIYLALSINRYTKDARPGVRKIAEDTGMAVNTVRAKIELLQKRGLLDVEKKDGKSNRYYPADYATVSKFDTPSGATVSKNPPTVSKNPPTVSTTRRKNAQLEELEELDSMGGLSKKELEQANAKVDAILEGGKKARYANREKLPETYWKYSDLYHELTRQEPTKRVLMDWMQTFEEWKQEGLQPEHIRAAFEYANRPEGGFMVGRPGALTNTAVAMKTKMHLKEGGGSGKSFDPFSALYDFIEGRKATA